MIDDGQNLHGLPGVRRQVSEAGRGRPGEDRRGIAQARDLLQPNRVAARASHHAVDVAAAEVRPSLLDDGARVIRIETGKANLVGAKGVGKSQGALGARIRRADRHDEDDATRQQAKNVLRRVVDPLEVVDEQGVGPDLAFDDRRRECGITHDVYGECPTQREIGCLHERGEAAAFSKSQVRQVDRGTNQARLPNPGFADDQHGPIDLDAGTKTLDFGLSTSEE
jgi:hypothetical protein